MNRAMMFVVLMLAATALSTRGQEPRRPQLTPEEQSSAAQAEKLNREGGQLYQQGKLAAALEKWRQALELRQQLYPASKYPDGQADLATSLNNMGIVLRSMGQAEKALTFYQQSLDMSRKLYPLSKYPDGHAYLATDLNNMGSVQESLGRAETAVTFYQQSLDMRNKLYPASKYPDGHADLANSLNSLGHVSQMMGQTEKAVNLYQHSLDMRQRLYPASKFPNGHLQLASSLNNMGGVLEAMGQAEKALTYFQQGLDMMEKLYPESKYPDGHPGLAISINNLGFVLKSMGRAEKALTWFQQGLDMQQKLYPASRYPNGHPLIAISLNNLGSVLNSTGQPEKALTFHQQSLDIREKLYPASKYPDGHPDLATSLNNLGLMFQKLGQEEKALTSFQKGLDMDRKLYPASSYPDGHPDIARSLHNLGGTLHAMRRTERAADVLEQAVRMKTRLVRRETTTASESVALDLIAQLRRGTSHFYYSAAVQLPHTEADSYVAIWNAKGTVQRLLTRRHLTATVARHQSSDVRHAFERLSDTQREIGRLYATSGKNLTARDKRLTQLSDERDRLTRELAQALPAVQRDEELSDLMPRDLLAALPDHTVLIDFVRYNHWDNDEMVGSRYLAFILAKDRPIRRLVLNSAKEIDAAIAIWRQANPSRGDTQAPQELRQLIWTKLAPHIPADTKTLYISPDGDLARLPWAALPIALNRVLLEDYAVAIMPHGRFLLEQLKYPPNYAGPESIFALGNVTYGAGIWPALPATTAELKSLQNRAEGRTFVSVSEEQATAAKVRETLPAARYAHFATHGFFDADELTKEKKREALAAKSRVPGDDTRSKVATKNPLGFVGLVLANDEVMNGLTLVDLPLENLRLVTLSACETGLGEYTAGEGVQGLQRAFHIAGCPNVVASLWKVNDAATAALMAKFYHELWVNKKPPIEALREAQLTIYRRPDLIPDLAGERGAPRLKEAVAVQASGAASEKASGAASARRATADTKLWAAFVLSGVGK